VLGGRLGRAEGDTVKAEDESLFQQATGWTGPFNLTVTNEVSKETQQFPVERPYAIVGQSSQADVLLQNGQVGFRHAYLQMVAGQLVVVDCGSKLGTLWDEGRKKTEWLVGGRKFRVGDYSVQLADDAAPGRNPAASVPLDFLPLKRYRDQIGPLPTFEIEFLNAQIKSLVVTLRHMMTLVGRHRACKFHFDDESVSHMHASLLRTPLGLWVVDLLGRDGTNVNSKPVRFALVEDGDVITVGRYRMRVRSGARDEESALTDDEAPSQTRPVAASTILISSNKVFVVEQAGDSLIVTPEGAPKQFRYADVHHEANRVLNLLADPEIKNLIVDLAREEVFTSVAIGVFNRLRNAVAVRGGRVAICNASEQMEQILREMGLYGLWLHFRTREEALAVFRA
jgi:pSer/pThr/pTyr-binding forkhead associated (FHA) protein/anti-anti-sigma regulatory factor